MKSNVRNLRLNFLKMMVKQIFKITFKQMRKKNLYNILMNTSKMKKIESKMEKIKSNISVIIVKNENNLAIWFL